MKAFPETAITAKVLPYTSYFVTWNIQIVYPPPLSVRMFMWSHIWSSCSCGCVYLCLWKAEVNPGCCFLSPTWFISFIYLFVCWDEISHWDLELTNKVRLNDQLVLGTCLSLPSHSWDYEHASSCLLFTWVLGSKLGSRCLCGKYFTGWTISALPKRCILKSQLLMIWRMPVALFKTSMATLFAFFCFALGNMLLLVQFAAAVLIFNHGVSSISVNSSWWKRQIAYRYFYGNHSDLRGSSEMFQRFPRALDHVLSFEIWKLVLLHELSCLPSVSILL